KEVTGFVPSQDHPGLYEANVDGVDRIMQIYVNGKKRWMARSNEFVKGVEKNDSYDWDDPDTDYTYDGIYMSKQDIGFWDNPNDILFQWERNWKTQIVYPEEIMQDPDNADQVIVRMQRGFWNLLRKQEKTSEQPMYPQGSVYFRIINAMELLDSPGEFYYNRATKKLYYMPEADEDMSTANVVVPRIDHFATIYGNDKDDCVQNIDFKGMTIAHFASNSAAEGYWGEQGTVVRPASGTQGVGRCGIYMFFCDNVNFYDNYFYGFDEVCINMQGGVRNCSVTGNAFSDIGDAAVTIGHERHANTSNPDSYAPVPSNADTTQMVLTRDYERMAIYTSYIGDNYSNNRPPGCKGLNFVGNLNGNDISGSEVNKSYMPTGGYVYKNYHWRSDPADVGKEKSYVMYDFYSKFKIDKVTLCWDRNLIQADEIANFEVLLSNDKSFTTYDTLYTENGTYSGAILEIPNSSLTGKYRYLMIRTIGNTRFGLSQVYAFTSDLKPYTYNVEPTNITVSNNYMTRIGGEIPRSCAIMAYYVNGFNVTHNELFDIGYSGIEIGWGWDTAKDYTRNVNCSYNSVDTTCHILFDGGPIYTLGPQQGSIYRGNYMNNCIMGVHSLYTDTASKWITWCDNVVENSHYVISLYNEKITDNYYYNNYATHNQKHMFAGGTINGKTYPPAKDSNTFDDYANTPIVFPMGQPPQEARKIIYDSGLEASYKHIKKWVPEDVENGLPEEAISYIRAEEYNLRKTYNSMHKKELYNMIKKEAVGGGVFGLEEGQYPPKYKPILVEAYNLYIPDNATPNQTTLLRNLMNEVRESVKTKSLSETLAEIQELLENARTISDSCPCLASFSNASLYDTFGMMTKSSFDDIKARYQALNNSYLSGSAYEYALLVEAEALLAEAHNAVFSADIVSASTEGMTDVNIDKENEEVTFYFAPGTSLENKKLELTASHGAVIATNLSDLVDLSTPLTVTVYCTRNKGYKYWTVKAEYAEDSNVSLIGSTAGSGYTDADNWFSLRRGDKHVSPTYGGGLIIQKGAYATMAKSYDQSTHGASFTFAPLSQSGKHQFTMVLASQDYEIDNSLKNKKIDRLEIDFNDDKATLYRVKSGERDAQPIKSNVSAYLNYNQPNTISYSTSVVNSDTKVTVTINGRKVFDQATASEIQLDKGYFGFISQKCNIKIY
ncbi:MAG: hypothetical protein J5590_09660, partial [Clostridia bacterium]|nr:hypothetical protein [Clostridia bacterium]